MTTRTVFIGGVHGVGKTYFCRNVVGRFDVEHITASELIGRHIKHQADKTVPNVGKNQLILAEELACHQTNCRTILLDGHFCLLNSTLDIQNVPLETFRAISPCAIILLIDKPKAVVERLSNRDSHLHNVELIAELQSREIAGADFVSQSLGIPISVIEATEPLEQSIRKVAMFFEV